MRLQEEGPIYLSGAFECSIKSVCTSRRNDREVSVIYKFKTGHTAKAGEVSDGGGWHHELTRQASGSYFSGRSIRFSAYFDYGIVLSVHLHSPLSMPSVKPKGYAVHL